MSRSSIAFRETIRRAAIGERKYIRHFEGRGHFAHVKLELLPHDEEACIVTRAPDLAIPEDCYHAVRAAIFRRFDSGPTAHHPMRGVEVRLLEATHLPPHSYPEAFAMAAGMAFDEALFAASPVILEPWIGLRIHVQQDELADAIAALVLLLGKVDASVTYSDAFILNVETPNRLLTRACQMVGPRHTETFALPASREYRPMQASRPSDSQRLPRFEDWT